MLHFLFTIHLYFSLSLCLIIVSILCLLLSPTTVPHTQFMNNFQNDTVYGPSDPFASTNGMIRCLTELILRIGIARLPKYFNLYCRKYGYWKAAHSCIFSFYFCLSPKTRFLFHQSLLHLRREGPSFAEPQLATPRFSLFPVRFSSFSILFLHRQSVCSTSTILLQPAVQNQKAHSENSPSRP